MGRRKAIMVGLFVMASASCFFAFGAYFQRGLVFYAVSFLGRAIQGVADSLICIAIPSVVSIEYP
jgi:MFS family permease